MKLTINNYFEVEKLEDESILVGLKNNILDYEIDFTDEEREILKDYQNDGKRINIENGIIIDLSYMLPQFLQHYIQYH